jgi:hypothetical protein
MAANNRSHTPLLDHREKRTNTLFALPKTPGRSRHGDPVRASQRTASTNRRLSVPLRPGSPALARLCTLCGEAKGLSHSEQTAGRYFMHVRV